MVFSYYLNYPFYNIIWYILKIFRKKKKCILYCEDAFDIILYKNVGKYLQPVSIVAKNKKVREKLLSNGFKCDSLLPAFPDVVIMFRNMAWKFPCKKIIRIGFKHGAYNFKAHSKPHYYNMFDLFFLTSQSEINRVKSLGVSTELIAAYPKIDHLFDGSLNEEVLHKLRLSLNLDPTKKTLLFASTWDGSGMSAIEKWYDKISILKDKYNLLVTLHEWMSDKYKIPLKNNPDIYFIEEFDRMKYIALADICINDTSSLIAETNLLKKPLITFRVQKTNRTLDDVMSLIEKISIQIEDFSELENAIEKHLENPNLLIKEQDLISKIFFDEPDGLAGKRVADKIIELVPELK